MIPHTSINSSFIFFFKCKCFAFFKFTLPSQKSDINSVRIIFIKIIIIIKINFIKIYSKNMLSLAINVTLLKSSLKKSISSLTSKALSNCSSILLVTNQSGISAAGQPNLMLLDNHLQLHHTFYIYQGIKEYSETKLSYIS